MLAMENSSETQMAFLGDSLTEFGRDWNTRFKISGIDNLGLAGETSLGLLKSVHKLIKSEHSTVFVLIGVNDLNVPYTSTPVPTLIENLEVLVQELASIHTIHSVVLRCLFPTGNRKLNLSIRQVNNWIETTEWEPKVRVLNYWAYFIGKEGLLKDALTYDGLHFTEEGYQLWVDLEQKLINKISDSGKPV